MESRLSSVIDPPKVRAIKADQKCLKIILVNRPKERKIKKVGLNLKSTLKSSIGLKLGPRDSLLMTIALSKMI